MNNNLRQLAIKVGIQFDYNGSPVVDRSEYLEAFAIQILCFLESNTKSLSKSDMDKVKVQLGLMAPSDTVPYRSPTDIALGLY